MVQEPARGGYREVDCQHTGVQTADSYQHAFARNKTDYGLKSQIAREYTIEDQLFCHYHSKRPELRRIKTGALLESLTLSHVRGPTIT